MSAATSGLVLEVEVDPAAASLDPGIRDTITWAVKAADAVAGPVRGVLGIIVDSDERIRSLNRLWRRIDKPTNVLSFTYPDTGKGAPKQVGDIAISYETTAREAAEQGKPFAHHVAHLAVHGFLHVLGYDHESDEDADIMEGLERTILARVNVPDPYIARDAEG